MHGATCMRSRRSCTRCSRASPRSPGPTRKRLWPACSAMPRGPSVPCALDCRCTWKGRSRAVWRNCRATAREPPERSSSLSPSRRLNAPWWRPVQGAVVGVLWSEGGAYGGWGRGGGRLPTEDEWEAAARGPRGWRYPWGDRWERGRANADSVRDTFAPVGADSLGRSWVGAVDMIGNAWEWTATAGTGPGGAPGHVIRGGAFDTPPQSATAAFRAVFPDR